MGNTSYAITGGYGFGFVVKTSSSPEMYAFCNKVWIKNKDEKPVEYEIGTHAISIQQRGADGKYRNTPVPLYLIKDNNVWKEYFTGTAINCVDIGPEGSVPILYGNDVYANTDGGTGVRLFTVLHYYRGYGINYPLMRFPDAQEFGKEISTYSEDQIREIVKQFYDLYDKASKWGERFDDTVKRIANARLQSESKWANTLEKNAGAYSRDVLSAPKKTVTPIDVKETKNETNKVEAIPSSYNKVCFTIKKFDKAYRVIIGNDEGNISLQNDQYIVIVGNNAYKYQGGFNEIQDFIDGKKQGIVLEADGNIEEFKSLNVFDACNILTDQLIKGEGLSDFVTCGIYMEACVNTKETSAKSVLKNIPIIKKLRVGKNGTEEDTREYKYLEISYKGIDFIKKFFGVENIDPGLMHLLNVLIISKAVLNKEYSIKKI